MKVLASRTGGYQSPVYICEVSHTELEKFLNLYYGNLKPLKDGEEIDLAKGYDFSQQTREALKVTESFIKANGDVVKAILSGVTLFSNIAESSKTDDEVTP